MSERTRLLGIYKDRRRRGYCSTTSGVLAPRSKGEVLDRFLHPSYNWRGENPWTCDASGCLLYDVDGLRMSAVLAALAEHLWQRFSAAERSREEASWP